MAFVTHGLAALVQMINSFGRFNGGSIRRASFIYFAIANIQSLSLKLHLSNRRSSAPIQFTIKRSTHSTLLHATSHRVDNFLCNEVRVDFNVRGIQSIVILEADAESQEALINIALDDKSIAAEEDPYGSVLWPSAKTVSMRLLELNLVGKSILELGTGTGLVSLAATLSGAQSVLATDYSLFSLSLLDKAKTLQLSAIPEGVLTTQFLDVKDFSKPLPPADIVVIADLLYDKGLAVAVGKRVCEAYKRGSLVIVGNSPGRCGTDDMLHTCKEILGFEVFFRKMIGQTVIGHRHDLIGSTATLTPQAIDTTLLEIQLFK